MQDPHFKKANHRRRIISHALLSEYAFCLAPGGIIYTITDVQEVSVPGSLLGYKTPEGACVLTGAC